MIYVKLLSTPNVASRFISSSRVFLESVMCLSGTFSFARFVSFQEDRTGDDLKTHMVCPMNMLFMTIGFKKPTEM